MKVINFTSVRLVMSIFLTYMYWLENILVRIAISVLPNSSREVTYIFLPPSLPPSLPSPSIHPSHITPPQAFSQEIAGRQPEFDKILATGHNLLQLAHPRAVPVLQSKLQQLERNWVDLRGRVGEGKRGWDGRR